jgi:uncharacterized protein (TIGR03118 family)
VQANGRGFRVTKLVSDKPGFARITDQLVRNPWGIALGTGTTKTPLWVNNNGTGVSTIYAGANGKDPISKVPLDVKLQPGPTGIVFNDTKGFTIPQQGSTGPSTFIFDGFTGRSGYIDAWKFGDPPPTQAPGQVLLPQHIYLGLALAHTKQGPRLFASDVLSGRIDVYDKNFRLLFTPRQFVDPHLPKGYGPYNVAVLGHKVFVAYVPPEGTEAEIGGIIDVFDLHGRLLSRLVTGGRLDDPWGMAIAPPHWGGFGGALLVGNEEDGRINAYNPRTGKFRGTVRNRRGKPIAYPGLWGLVFGNGVTGTPRTLLFASGIDEYAHGLVGSIRPAR